MKMEGKDDEIIDSIYIPGYVFHYQKFSIYKDNHSITCTQDFVNGDYVLFSWLPRPE